MIPLDERAYQVFLLSQGLKLILWSLLDDGQCPWSIPGWAHINGKKVYMGAAQEDLSWHTAEAKALEVGAKLMSIESDQDEDVFEAIKKCTFLKNFGNFLKLPYGPLNLVLPNNKPAALQFSRTIFLIFKFI